MTPEEVPDEDDVSRHLFAPSMGAANSDLIWPAIFMFKTERGYCESLVWRKYAEALADVHELGCIKQSNDRAAGKNCTYFGALTANVGGVRAIRSKNGAKLSVMHHPAEGIHHVHICLVQGDRITKNDKTELKKAVQDHFSERSDHTCPLSANGVIGQNALAGASGNETGA